jgi:hypothetical protein
LRATDKIHRDIEDFLEAHGLYYDRRKNLHKNAGKPMSKIVSIPFMAQAILAIALQEPNNSRARPTSLLKNDQDYARVFNKDAPVALYLICALLLRRAESFLRTKDALDPNSRNNLKFYLAMYAAAFVSGKPQPTAHELASLSIDRFADDVFSQSFEGVHRLFVAHGGNDKAAKGRDLIESLKNDLRNRLIPALQ